MLLKPGCPQASSVLNPPVERKTQTGVCLASQPPPWLLHDPLSAVPTLPHVAVFLFQPCSDLLSASTDFESLLQLFVTLHSSHQF